MPLKSNNSFVKIIAFNFQVYFPKLESSAIKYWFNPQIGPYQVPPHRARADLGAMAMKGRSAFPKTPASLEPHHLIV